MELNTAENSADVKVCFLSTLPPALLEDAGGGPFALMFGFHWNYWDFGRRIEPGV